MTIQFNYHWNGQDGIKTLSTVEEARLVSLGIARYYTPFMDGGPSDAGARSLEIHPTAGLLSGGAALTPSQADVLRQGAAIKNRHDAKTSRHISDSAAWSGHLLQFEASDTAADTLYWPWVISTEEITSPLDAFYMYFSTDHDATVGGIYMASAPTPTGPWTQRGLVYVDDTGGSQTETPSVIYDRDAGTFRMFYQQASAKYGAGNATSAIGVQSTLSATSSDGLTWVKDTSFILDIPSPWGTVHGDGHTGYFTPFVGKNGLCAYSLHGGGNGGECVLWEGKTPAVWATNRVSLGYGYELTGGLTYSRVEWNHCSIVEASGQEYVFGLITDGVSGGAEKNARLFASRVSANYRFLTEAPKIIWEPDEAWESADIRSCCSLFVDGVLYVYYTIGKTKIGVMSHVL